MITEKQARKMIEVSIIEVAREYRKYFEDILFVQKRNITLEDMQGMYQRSIHLYEEAIKELQGKDK